MRWRCQRLWVLISIWTHFLDVLYSWWFSWHLSFLDFVWTSICLEASGVLRNIYIVCMNFVKDWKNRTVHQIHIVPSLTWFEFSWRIATICSIKILYRQEHQAPFTFNCKKRSQKWRLAINWTDETRCVFLASLSLRIFSPFLSDAWIHIQTIVSLLTYSRKEKGGNSLLGCTFWSQCII